MQLYYLNPVLCAIIFACATLLLKRGLHEGAGATRAVFVTNATFFFCLLPLWWMYPTHIPVELLWAPVAAGLVAFLGSLFQTLALKVGDASVATPLLGGKVVFVALFSTLILGNVLPTSWWLAAVLSGMGVFLIGRQPGGKAQSSKLGLTVLLSMLSVSSFALMDIIIAGWGKSFGFQRFVVIQQVFTFGFSLCLIPFFTAPLRSLSRSCWGWLLGGSALIVLQFFILNWTISNFGNPTAINIFYSSRGLWTLLLVWTVGPLFGNRERNLGGSVFMGRTLGAILLLGSVLIVVLEDASTL